MHNVVVTTGQLVPTLGKLLLFHLSTSFPPEGIYSARNHGKEHCFTLIRERFGAAPLYCAIGMHCSIACSGRNSSERMHDALNALLSMPSAGDGVEEQQCARQFGWPFIRIVMDGLQAGKGTERLAGGSAKWQPLLLTDLQVYEVLEHAASA